jgi:hypothetical protein
MPIIRRSPLLGAFTGLVSLVSLLGTPPVEEQSLSGSVSLLSARFIIRLLRPMWSIPLTYTLAGSSSAPLSVLFTSVSGTTGGDCGMTTAKALGHGKPR